MTITPDFVHSVAFADSIERIRLVTLESGNHLHLYVTRPLDAAGNPQSSQIAARIFDPTGTSLIDSFDVTEHAFDFGNPHDFEVVATDGGVALAYLAENEFGHKAVWLGEIGFDATGDHSIKHTMIEPFQLHPIKSPSLSYQAGEPGTPAHVQVNWTYEDGGSFGVEGRSVALGATNTVGAREKLSSSGLGPTSDEGLESVSAALTGGQHVVVSTTGSTTTLIPDAIKFRIVDETGSGVSFSKQVGNTAGNFEIDDQPAVAALNDGGFVVAWRNNDGGVATEIQMARYDDQGVHRGTVQTIPVDPGISYSEPEWVLMPNGSLGLAWLEHGGANSQVGFSAVNINSGAFAQTGPIRKIVTSDHPIEDLSVDAAADGRILVSALFDENPSGDAGLVHRSFIYDTAGLLMVGKAGEDDVLVARDDKTVVYGDGFSGGPAGNDTLYAFGEGDELRGGKGKDLLISGDGVDTLDGGDGNDVLISGDQSDILIGGKGNDLLVSGKEANTLDGGDGYDTVSYENSTYGVTVWLGEDQPGAPTLPDPDGGDSNGDVLVSIEALIGSDRGDHLFGALNGGSMLKGGGGTDFLQVSGGGNRVEGGAGEDTLLESLEASADGDADLFLAWDGNDSILVGRGVNTVEAGDGDDSINLMISRAIVGGQAVEFDSRNFVDGGDGFDKVFFNGAPTVGIDMDLSQNRVVRERGVDIITNVEQFYGTSQDDKMLGDSNDNGLDGEIGDDLIEGRGGNDVLDGYKGDDTINGGTGHDTIHGGDGDDDVHGGDGRDSVFLDAGDDQFTDTEQTGVNGQDTVSGGAGKDVILGRGGNDVLSGDAGEDWIEDGEGADTIDGGSHYDTIYAGAGDDDVRGGDGRDSVFLGAGDDSFTDNDQTGINGQDSVYGGHGKDVISGRGGNDVLSGDAGEDWIEGGEGADTIDGGSHYDTIYAGAGDDDVRGGDGRDSIFLDAGNDRFTDNEQAGVNGQDSVSGGAGDDTLVGGGGDDRLEGGEDDDVLTGGQGADTFVFLEGHGSDAITDFELGVDRVSIDGNILDLEDLGPDITVARDGTDAVVYYGLNGDEIRFEGHGGADWVDSQAPIGQAGQITVAQSGPEQWHSISFDIAIADAVVVVGPVSYNGAHPSVARVRNVTDTGFEFQLDEWDYLDGGHIAETVGWVAISEGAHVLSNGQKLVAGTRMVDDKFASVSFGTQLDDSIVLSQATTVNGSAAVTTRIKSVDEDGFDIRLQEEESADGIHAIEEVSFLAIETGTGNGIEARQSGDTVTDQPESFDFVETFQDTPVLLADVQSYDGTDPAALRYDSLSTNSVSLFVEEEQSLDVEMVHTSEVVGFLALEEGFLF